MICPFDIQPKRVTTVLKRLLQLNVHLLQVLLLRPKSINKAQGVKN